MKRLLQLHLSLVKYLLVEIPKKKNLKDLIKFLKETITRYAKVMLQEYKNVWLVFDTDYQTQKKQYEKMQQLKVDLKRCVKMLEYIDTQMVKEGKNRQEIRQFWLDFTKNGQVRKEVFDQLMKEIR